MRTTLIILTTLIIATLTLTALIMTSLIITSLIMTSLIITYSLCLLLSLNFQKSFNNSDLPDVWKRASVEPVFKGKGNKYDVNNYRPISLTSTIGKEMETMVHIHKTVHSDKFKFLHSAQRRFRNKQSTTLNLLELLDDLTCYINNGHSVDLITIDIFKAVDSISYNKLIYKLETFGICGKILLWIKEFSNNRSFVIKSNNYVSIFLPVISSVPQGSKLGPLLYILYANDIMQNFKFAKVKMYADDVTVYAVVNNVSDGIKLQNELNHLLE